jgi:hypothetical protein
VAGLGISAVEPSSSATRHRQYYPSRRRGPSPSQSQGDGAQTQPGLGLNIELSTDREGARGKQILISSEGQADVNLKNKQERRKQMAA